MSNPNDPPLDEIQWRSPPLLASMGGLHSNTILFYFAESPFFERTSNNAIIMSQAMNNMGMYHFIQTREAFEDRLKTMSGLEFIVGEEPAEMAPGMGTGVWVIRKQTRRKRYDEEDEVMVHASFFVVGENIYMAPTLQDILASRIVSSAFQSRSVLILIAIDDDILSHRRSSPGGGEHTKMATFTRTCLSTPLKATSRTIQSSRVQGDHPDANSNGNSCCSICPKER